MPEREKLEENPRVLGKHHHREFASLSNGATDIALTQLGHEQAIETTKEDMDYVVDHIKEIVTKLRTMSPLYEDFVKKNN